MNKQTTSPTHAMEQSRIDSSESTLLWNSHRKVMLPAPSAYNSFAAGNIINTNHSCNVVHGNRPGQSVIVMNDSPSACDSAPVGDIVNANPGCSIDATSGVVNANPSCTVKTTQMDLTCVVNWDHIRTTVDSRLGKYNGCKGSGLYLADKSTCSFASSLKIFYHECDSGRERDRLDIRYMKKS